MKLDRFAPDEITVLPGLRPLDTAAVDRLAEGFTTVGMQMPPTVRWVVDADGNDEVVLVAGRHRLAAARKLNWTEIECSVVVMDDKEARLWEIAENLHRAELTVQERADHIAEWVRLTNEKGAHCGPPLGGVQPNAKGIKAAVRDLGIERHEAQRAVKIASIEPNAREAADAAGLNTQKARLEIASAAPADQVNRVAEMAARSKPVPLPKNELETEDDWRNGMMRMWNRAPDGWRERFIDYVQSPVFDNTRAGAA